MVLLLGGDKGCTVKSTLADQYCPAWLVQQRHDVVLVDNSGSRNAAIG